MNSRPHKLIIASLIFVHLTIIIKLGYFLSPEFTLYPYLFSHGFLPYTNIIDQHLPTLLFGVFSLPSFLTTNPQPLTIFFLSLIALTDTFFFYALYNNKVKYPTFWLIFWIISHSFFSGNILWYETFIALFVSLIFYVSFTKRVPSWLKEVCIGFLSGLIILYRPTLVFGIFALILILRPKINRHLITGVFLPLAISALFVSRFNLIQDFINIWEFNSKVYPIMALKYPNTRQIIYLLSFSFALLSILFSNKKKLLVAALFLIPAWPRFGFEHLLPFFLVSIFFLSQSFPVNLVFTTPSAIFIFLVLAIKLVRPGYGNFYLNQETLSVVDQLSQSSGTYVYIFGGNDLIYPLSHKLPPNNFYLPSLPWYLSQKEYESRQISSLKLSPYATVLVKENATVDNKPLISENSDLYKYIKENYQLVKKVNSYQFYESRY